jgi:voltage-gated potassium channel
MKKLKNYFYLALGLILYLILLSILAHFEPLVGGNIQNIGDAFWYSIVTMATVGYGDKFPISWEGKIAGTIFIISSMGILGTFISKTSRIFHEKLERRKMGLEGTDFKKHIIVIGYDNFARLIIENLISEKEFVVLITNEKSDLEEAYEKYHQSKYFFALLSEYDDFERLKLVNFSESHVVYLNLQTDSDNILCILNLKNEYKHLKYLVTLNDIKLKKPFESAGVNYIISKEDIASKLISSYIFEEHAADFNLDIMSSSKNNFDFDTMQFLVESNNIYLNKTYKYFFDDIRTKGKILPVGINKNGNSIKLPDDDVLIELGNYLLVIGNMDAKEYLESIFGKQGHKK